MAEALKVTTVADVPPGEVRTFLVGGRRLAIANAGGSFYAIDDVCTHDGGPLAEGQLEGYTIACPRHGAKFDIRTGQALTMPATEPTAAHEVKVDGGEVYVKLRES